MTAEFYVERHYSHTDGEALAIMWTCEKFHVFPCGKDFMMVTDNKSLETIYSSRSKIERWALSLDPYGFKVTYKPAPTPGCS